MRNLWKRKATTAINVAGLAVGLASCALCFLYFQHEKSFDQGFDKADQIYRITSSFNGDAGAPTVGLPYAKYLKSEVTEVEDVTRMDPTIGTTVVQVNGPGVNTPFTVYSGYWVDPNFFDILSFHFLAGDRKKAFDAPNTVVLSQTLAANLFGKADPVGKSIKAHGTVYMVTGVLKDDLLNHIQPDFLASNNSTGIRELMANNNSWVVNDNFYTYVRLKPGSNIPQVVRELNAYLQRHAGDELKAHHDHITNGLQALKDIHLNSSGFQDYLEYKQGKIKYLYLLGSIALVILLLACINYMNLATAQAVSRSREVGVRRVMGAGKNAIRYQFLLETVVISFFALVLAVALAFLFLPVFNSLTGQFLSFFAKENSTLALWMILVALVTGLGAGVYPAFYLSAFNPVSVLKGKVSDSAGMFSVRKVLIISQFVISTCLIFATMVIWNQLHFMLNAKTGFDQDQQLVLSLAGDQAQKNSAQLAQELKSHAAFKSVTIATAPLVSDNLNLFPTTKSINDKQEVFVNYTDGNYVKSLGLDLISGNNFSPGTFSNTHMEEDTELHDLGREIILNEEAARVLGFDPYTAPGKYVSHLRDGVLYNYRIAGVVRNYHYFSMHANIGPCALIPVNPLRCTTLIAKISGNQAAAGLKFAADEWKKLNPDTPFAYMFLDYLFQSDYQQDQRQQKMSSIFTGLAIFISCLGLLGLITYSLTQKSREIGIRKVIGASVANIVLLFFRQYFRLVLIANVIALPVAWYLMSNWLRDFPYRTGISWWIFAASLSAGVFIAFGTIAFKTIRAANANPVNSLRIE